MSPRRYNEMMLGLLDTVREMLNGPGFDGGTGLEIAEIGKMIRSLEMLWNRDSELTAACWSLEFRKMIEVA